jgi:hypothetical protein
MAITTSNQGIYHTFNTQFAEQLSIIKSSIKDDTFYYTEDDTNLCIKLGKDQEIMVTCPTKMEYDTLLSYITYLHIYYKEDMEKREMLDVVYHHLVTHNVYIESIYYTRNKKGEKLELKFNNNEKYVLSRDTNSSSLPEFHESIKFLWEFSSDAYGFDELYNLKCIAKKYDIKPYIISNEKNQYDNNIILDIVDANNVHTIHKFAFAIKKYGQHLLDYINKSQR